MHRMCKGWVNSVFTFVFSSGIFVQTAMKLFGGPQKVRAITYTYTSMGQQGITRVYWRSIQVHLSNYQLLTTETDAAYGEDGATSVTQGLRGRILTGGINDFTIFLLLFSNLFLFVYWPILLVLTCRTFSLYNLDVG